MLPSGLVESMILVKFCFEAERGASLHIDYAKMSDGQSLQPPQGAKN
jgi:hypothetical protein